MGLAFSNAQCARAPLASAPLALAALAAGRRPTAARWPLAAEQLPTLVVAKPLAPPGLSLAPPAPPTLLLMLLTMLSVPPTLLQAVSASPAPLSPFLPPLSASIS